MPRPTIIIEIEGGVLNAVYSNTDVSVFLVDQDNFKAGDPLIGGPFSPTLIKEDLSKLYPDDDIITEEILARPPLIPYF